MDFLLPVVLLVAAIAFIFMPFWGGASAVVTRKNEDSILSTPILDLDRELGKVDEAEWRELRPQTIREEKRPLPSVESLILAVRRARRLDVAAESEILVARARQRGKSSRS